MTVASFRSEDRDLFEAVRDGRKRIEVRAATLRFVTVEPGTTLTLRCDGEVVSKKVISVHRFQSVDALLQSHDISQLMPGVDPTQFKQRVEAFPGYAEKIAAHGLLAFELEEAD